jgi:hypothetical protein
MSEEPDREVRPGTESVPPGAGRVFAGILLLLFGACILLVGGACTMLWLVVLLDNQSWGHESGPGLLLVSLVTAGIGLFAVVKGVQLLRGPRRGG